MGDMEMQVTLKMSDQLSAASAAALGGLRKSAVETGVAFEAALRAERSGGRAAQAVTRIVTQQTAVIIRASRATRVLGGNFAAARVHAAAMSKTLAALGRGDRNILGMAKHVRQLGEYARSAEKGLLGAARAAGRFGRFAIRGGRRLAAGGSVIGRALAGPMDWDTRISAMATTADPEAKGKDWRALKGRLNEAVKTATQYGGTPETALGALEKLLNSKSMSAAEAERALPSIMKTATAAPGVSPDDLADFVISGVRGKSFTAAQIPAALDKTFLSGVRSGATMPNTLNLLRPFMGFGKGVQGMAGYESLLAEVQGAARFGGPGGVSDLRELWGDVSARTTAENFRKYLNVNLPGSLSRAGAKGEMPLDAFVGIVRKSVVDKDPRIWKLLHAAELAQAGGDTAAANEAQSSATDLLANSDLGKALPNRGSIRALVGLMAHGKFTENIRAHVHAARGETTENAYGNMAGTPGYVVQQAKNQEFWAKDRLFGIIGKPLAGMIQWTTRLARRFPNLAAAAAGAFTLFQAADSAGMFAGRGGLPRKGRLAGRTAGASIPFGERMGSRFKAGWAGKSARWLGRLGGLFGLLGTAASVYDTESNANLTRAQKNAQHVGTAAGFAGGWGGAVLGAKIGAGLGTLFVPGLGTVICAAAGAIGGGLLGSSLGGKLGQKAGELLFADRHRRDVIKGELKGNGRDLYAIITYYAARDAARC